MAANPAYSDDKIVVDRTHHDYTDLKAPILSEQAGDKTVTSHDEKMPSESSKVYSDEKVASNSSKGFSDEKMSATEASNVSAPSDGKEAFVPGGTDDKIPAADTATPQAAEKIPADESISSATQRTPTDGSWATQTRSTSRSYREYTFHHASWKLNQDVVVDPNLQAVYFTESSGFSRSREDVVLHSVSSNMAMKGTSLTPEEGKCCQSVAFAQFAHRNPDSVQLGLGTSDRMNTVKWSQLTRSGEADDWRLIIPNGSGTLTFRLSTAANAGDAYPETPASMASVGDVKAAIGSFKLVDSGLGIPLAAYTEQKALTSFKKRGKLRLFDGALSDIKSLSEQEMEQLVVLACAVLNEKRRRKSFRKWTGIGG